MELVEWVASLIAAWGENLAGSASDGWTTEDIHDADPEVRAAARLAPDHDAPQGARTLEIRFKRRGPGRHRERYLYVKFAPTARRLDHPRVWRKLGRLPKSGKFRRHRRLGLVELSRIIYWNEEALLEDIRAQIVIAVVQLKLVPTETAVYELVKYIRSFRKWISHDTAWDVASELYQYWSFPEDFRAFRKYVSIRLRVARGRQVLEAKEIPIRVEDLARRIRDAETSIELDDDGEMKVPRESAPPVLIPTAEWMTVEDAARSLDLSPSYVYKIIKRRGLEAQVSDGRVGIRKEDIDHILGQRAEKILRQQMQENLVAGGVKYAAARKRVYRERGSLPRLQAEIDSPRGS